MSSGKWLFILVLCAMSSLASAQRIVYSTSERDDTRKMNFDIVGKIDGNFLVYKNIRNNNSIVLFNDDMQQIAKVDQDYLPDYDRMINVDFFAYSNFFRQI